MHQKGWIEMYLIYNNSTVKYDCLVNKENDNIIVTFKDEFEPNTNGFRIFMDNGKLLGDYSEYINIVDSHVDGFTYSKDKNKEEYTKEKTLGEKLEDAQKKINILEEQIKATSDAFEDFILNVYSKEEGAE